MPRSLKASQQGIETAKKALTRKNSTQLALANEKAIASWTTINNFFNGKPVSRSIFQEICKFLDLEWEEIAAVNHEVDAAGETKTPEAEPLPNVETIIPEPFPTAGTRFSLPEAVNHSATRTRAALDPYILPLVRRDALLEKCLKLLRAGIFEGKRRVIPILGAAGYGKSTILGNLYDELQTQLKDAGSGWLALARCDDFIETAETFALELGEKVSSQRLSIIEIAKQLTATHNRGVLFIDTLDIILTKSLVPVLRGILSELLEAGTTVVFTCRDTDYSNFFEPYHESFAGFRESVQDGCKIPAFNDDEVFQAAQKFAAVQTRPDDSLFFPTPESQLTFAGKIVTLSADSKSLQEIVRHPLLLALLCDLFAAEEIVPEDLTVSQLYEKYWDWKITKIRHNQQSTHLGFAKEKLCLKLTELMYKNSGERLRDFVFETSLDLTETEHQAWQALKSDNILKDLGGRRIGFFHQTFLEYAIARWLTCTEAGELAKTQLKTAIHTSNWQTLHHYIWPIFRQLLTRIELAEFYQTCEQLDKTQILPFRAVAFAAVSRIEPEASNVLLSMRMLAQDYAFQEALLIAANSAPNRHGETVWEVSAQLLESAGTELINKAIEIATDLLVRLKSHQVQRFEQALNALKKSRTVQTAKNSEEKTFIWGQFIRCYGEKLKTKGEPIDSQILKLLETYYGQFGSQARAATIRFYLAPDVPKELQQEFFLSILQQPLINKSFAEGEVAKQLFKQLLPEFLRAGNTPFGKTWLEALQTPLLEPCWMSVTAGAVGAYIPQQPNLAEQIITHLFLESAESVSKDFHRSGMIALQEACCHGGANLIASVLLKVPIHLIPSSRYPPLLTLLRALTGEDGEQSNLDKPLQRQLAEWLAPVISQDPVNLVRALETLTINDEQTLQLFGEILDSLLPQLPQQQVNQILKKLRHIPLHIEPYLQQTAHSKESRAALLKLYHQQTETNFNKVASKVINDCLDSSQDVAKDASWIVLEWAQQQKPINPETLQAIFANSPVISVRQNCLKALIELVNGKKVSQAQILTTFQTLSHDSAPEVLQSLYKLVDTAMWNHPCGSRAIDLPLAEAVFDLTQFLAQNKDKKLLDMVTRSAWLTLNQMVLIEDERIIPAIGTCARTLLRQVDTRSKIDKLMVTGLLNSVAKFEKTFLATIVLEDLVVAERIMPVANQQAVALSITHNQGKNSSLLDAMLNHPKIPEEVKSRILRERGA